MQKLWQIEFEGAKSLYGGKSAKNGDVCV